MSRPIIAGARTELQDRLAQVERKVRRLELTTAKTLTFIGPRTDTVNYPHGIGPRVRIGLLPSDNTYGIERISADGNTISRPTWS